MVKKLKYLLFLFPFLFITNVNAVQLGTPYVMAHFNDDTIIGPSNATIDSYFNGTNNYYKSPYLMGGVSNQQWVNRIDFNYNNANLCVNNDLSISGSIAGIQGMFSDQSYSLVAVNNAKTMSCSYSYDWYGTRLNFNCYGQGGGTLSLYLYMNSFSQPVQYTIGVSRDMTVSCDASNLDVIANATQNTQNIINNQNSNTNSIIQDNQQNTQDIIDNQNQNTQQEIESQKVCKTIIIDKKYAYQQNKAISNTGEVVDSISSNGITDYLDITNVTNIKNLSTTDPGTNFYFCTYNSNKVKVNCYNRSSYVNQTISISTNERYVRFSLNIPSDRPQFEYIQCQNGNQALNDSVNGLNDTLNDTSQPNTNQDINDMNDMVASDTPISDLITMPLTLINAYINGVNSSCSPVNLGNLYGTNLTLPCINLEQRLGSNLWHIIDAFFSIFMCYNIGMLFITAFDGITSLRDDFEGLYQPRHADTGYVPKHGGGN